MSEPLICVSPEYQLVDLLNKPTAVTDPLECFFFNSKKFNCYLVSECWVCLSWQKTKFSSTFFFQRTFPLISSWWRAERKKQLAGRLPLFAPSSNVSTTFSNTWGIAPSSCTTFPGSGKEAGWARDVAFYLMLILQQLLLSQYKNSEFSWVVSVGTKAVNHFLKVNC